LAKYNNWYHGVFVNEFMFYITTTIASTTNIQRNRQINVGRRAVKGAKIND